jgi:hypothetical protein
MTEEPQKKRKLSENEEEEETTGKEGQKKVQGNNISVEELREHIKASNILGFLSRFHIFILDLKLTIELI